MVKRILGFRNKTWILILAIINHGILGKSFAYSFNKNVLSNYSLLRFVLYARHTMNKTDIVPGLMEFTF